MILQGQGIPERGRVRYLVGCRSCSLSRPCGGSPPAAAVGHTGWRLARAVKKHEVVDLLEQAVASGQAPVLAAEKETIDTPIENDEMPVLQKVSPP